MRRRAFKLTFNAEYAKIICVMSILTIKGLSHTYDNKVLFDDADLP